MNKTILLLFLSFFITTTKAQEYFPNNESVQNRNDNFIAFTNAKIIIDPSTTIENGTLIIQKGKVYTVGIGVSTIIPKNAIVINLQGKYVYPSFIDMYTNFGIQKPKANNEGEPTYDTSRKGFYWNDHIRPETIATDYFKFDQTKAEELLKAGFGIVGTHLQDGVARGTGALIALNTNDASSKIVSNAVSNHFGFTKSVTSTQSYPSSLMGMIALLRQMYFDMNWYKNGNSTTKDASLDALIKNEKLTQIFEANDKLNSFRVAKIGKEFNINYVLKGAGNEFERIEEIKKLNSKFIIPVNFPEAYDVSDPYQANQMELYDMRFWNQAPTNLKVLSDNGIVFALTTDKLKKIEDFRTNLLKAIKLGFDKKKALESLTTIPASLLGKSNEIGSLNKGNLANFIIASGEVFDEKTTFYENWVQGNKFVINDMNVKDIRGNYDLSIGSEKYKLKISGEITAPTSEIKTVDDIKINSKLSVTNNWLNILVKTADSTKVDFSRLNALLSDDSNYKGKATLINGQEINWSAQKISPLEIVKEEVKVEKTTKIYPVTFPNLPYGSKEKLTAQSYLFKNTTIWTNEKEGVLTETDVLIVNGKVTKIAKNIADVTATIIDAKGKHLTAGIIDEHSHIAISRGVNEGGHNSSAEVSIQDVVNSEDVNIYRDLAGGVTTSQLLHGSANPIGGQSAIVKWKWGQAPEEMLYKNQPKFIKFALGENVKQSNWGLNNPTRFPQTRMGVEQVYLDYFQRAKEYEAVWTKYNSDPKKSSLKAPRYDIELNTLAEIINKTRFITCHSYVQSEILMLMNVAEKFNFNINTFTHILEGYKVADKMKAHGVGASTFSDWWAYKFEVNDAIPYNGPILHEQGVVVAYNSDDAEMSRRLNQEAAKAVKYGNVSEEEAWKFVTLNPAKLLHIDDKVGSVKVGKDADLVLWSDNPLSIYAKAEKTMIEGIIYFDINKDEQLRKEISTEKNELINLMLQEKNKGMTTQEPKKKEKKEYHCDTQEEN